LAMFYVVVMCVFDSVFMAVNHICAWRRHVYSYTQTMFRDYVMLPLVLRTGAENVSLDKQTHAYLHKNMCICWPIHTHRPRNLVRTRIYIYIHTHTYMYMFATTLQPICICLQPRCRLYVYVCNHITYLIYGLFCLLVTCRGGPCETA